MQKFWNWIHDDSGGRVLRLEGPIDSESFWGNEITPQDFRNELYAEDGDVTIFLNSPGGNVFAAAEIYTMIRDYPHNVTVKIASIAASAASVIAMAGDTVLMSPTALLFVHDPSTIAMGNAKDMEKVISTLNAVKESMALKKNKVKFGLNKVHYAKITAWSEDGVPTFATPVRIPGAVSLSIDANGENENFYADNTVYYVINNNAGYTGDLEIALIPTDFATEILGEIQDTKGVLVERNDAETSQFALLFEFSGDKNKIRHIMYCCSASRPKTESSTTEESTEVKTETLSLKASALPDGLVKSKTCENTDETTYNNWYKAVYIPVMTAAAKSASSAKSTSAT